jgi:mannose/fructose/N-acetylgalactosamine-specific phosphotransferase system component IIB
MIALARCDDRMIHGQCIVRVLSDFKIDVIVGVDDFAASNPVLKNIYVAAAPPGMKNLILTAEQAVKETPEHIASSESVLFLFKDPLTALTVFRAVPNLSKELNIGPVSNRRGTAKATMYAYLTLEEASALDEISAMGVRVYFNQVTDQKFEEWTKIRSVFKK